MSESEGLDPLDEIVEQFLAEVNAGRRPSIDSYLQRFPELAEELREVLEACALINEADPNEEELEPPISEAAGTRVGEYVILGEIGRGGMGVVYEAEQESLGRRVALKLIQQSYAKDAEARERFRREARAAARLHHTNIVPVFEVGETESGSFYAMQFINGRGLDEVRRELASETSSDTNTARSATQPASKPATRSSSGEIHKAAQSLSGSNNSASLLSSSNSRVSSATRTATLARAVADIGRQTADALAHAHTRGIIHRDIKPSNLILDEQGTVWVTDFGLAKVEDDDLTRSGAILGTLRYMSPERFQHECDERGDIYGLGISLYELLTVRDAFQSNDRVQLMARIQHDEPITPRQINSDIPKDLETIILKAIQKEPGRRYQSASEMATDLRLFLADRAITARRDTPVERLVRWSRRNKGLAASIAIIFVLLTVVAAGSLYLANYERSRRQDAILARDTITEERARAERNLEQALDAVDVMLTHLADARLASVPQTAEIRKSILEDAARFHRQFHEENRDEPRVHFLTTNAQTKLGMIYSLLNEHESSLASFESAIELLEVPRDYSRQAKDDWDQLVITCLVGYADALISMNRIQQAESAIQEAQRENSIVSDPVLRHKNEAILYANLARIAERQSDHQEAVAQFELTREIYAQLDAANQLEVEDSEKQLRSLLGLGTAYGRTGQFEDAMASYVEAQSLAKRLATAMPSNPAFRQSAGMASKIIGQQLGRQGRFQESTAQMHEAYELLGALSADYPSIPVYTYDYAGTCGDLGVAYARQRELERAHIYFDEAAQLLARLASDYPEVIDYSRILGYSYNNLAALMSDMGRHDESEEYFHKAIAARQQVLTVAPAQADYRSELAISQTGLASHYAEFGDLKDAIALFELAIESGEDLAREFPDNHVYRRKLAISYRSAAELRSRQGRPDTTQALERAEQLLLELIEETSDSVRNAHEYAKTIRTLAIHYLRNGELDSALNEFARIEQAYRDIRNRFGPDSIDINRGFIACLNQLGRLHSRAGEHQLARRYFDEVEELLATWDPDSPETQFANAEYCFYQAEDAVRQHDALGTADLERTKARCLTTRQLLLAQEDLAPSLQDRLMQLEYLLGCLDRRTGDTESAKSRFEHVLATLESNANGEPSEAVGEPVYLLALSEKASLANESTEALPDTLARLLGRFESMYADVDEDSFFDYRREDILRTAAGRFLDLDQPRPAAVHLLGIEDPQHLSALGRLETASLLTECVNDLASSQSLDSDPELKDLIAKCEQRIETLRTRAKAETGDRFESLLKRSELRHLQADHSPQ